MEKDQIHYEGYLEKKAKITWNKRYCVLDNNVMKWAKDEHSPPKKIIDISDAISVRANTSGAKGYPFDIVYPNETYSVTVDSARIREEWLHCLRIAMRFHRNGRLSEMSRPRCDSISSDDEETVNSRAYCTLSYPLKTSGTTSITHTTRRSHPAHLVLNGAASSSSTDSGSPASPNCLPSSPSTTSTSPGRQHHFVKKTRDSPTTPTAGSYNSTVSLTGIEGKRKLWKMKSSSLDSMSSAIPKDKHPLSLMTSVRSFDVPDNSAYNAKNNTKDNTKDNTKGSTRDNTKDNNNNRPQFRAESSRTSRVDENPRKSSVVMRRKSKGNSLVASTDCQNLVPPADEKDYTAVVSNMSPDRLKELESQLKSMTFDFPPIPELPHPRLELSFDSVFDKIRGFIARNRTSGEFYTTVMKGKYFSAPQPGVAIQHLKELLDELDKLEMEGIESTSL